MKYGIYLGINSKLTENDNFLEYIHLNKFFVSKPKNLRLFTTLYSSLEFNQICSEKSVQCKTYSLKIFVHRVKLESIDKV